MLYLSLMEKLRKVAALILSSWFENIGVKHVLFCFDQQFKKHLPLQWRQARRRGDCLVLADYFPWRSVNQSFYLELQSHPDYNINCDAGCKTWCRLWFCPCVFHCLSMWETKDAMTRDFVCRDLQTRYPDKIHVFSLRSEMFLKNEKHTSWVLNSQENVTTFLWPWWKIS